MLTIRRQRGLSLVELMISLAVLGVLVMTALPSYTAWIQNTKIRNAAESVQNGLQLARAEAVRQNTMVQFVLEPGSGWTVSVVGPPVVTIQSRDSAQGSKGVTVAAEPAGATTATFDSIGRRLTANPDSTAALSAVTFDVPTTILPADQSRELKVTVSAGGGIRMCDATVTDKKDTRIC